MMELPEARVLADQMNQLLLGKRIQNEGIPGAARIWKRILGGKKRGGSKMPFNV